MLNCGERASGAGGTMRFVSTRVSAHIAGRNPIPRELIECQDFVGGILMSVGRIQRAVMLAPL